MGNLMPRVQEKGMFAYRVSGRTEYLTPKWLLDALGPFDLDPCASEVRPWPVAKVHYTEGGLEKPWKGLAFVNPPYGRANGERAFIEKLADHGNGVALVGSKTETFLWQEVIFPRADAILFLGRGKHLGMVSNRISFCNTDGSSTGGSFEGSALVAFGQKAVSRLRKSKLPGFLTTTYERND